MVKLALKPAQLLTFVTLFAAIGFCQTTNYYYVEATACGTGYDVGALINACLSSGMIPTASDGLQVGTILLPNTSVPNNGSVPAWVWATPVVLGPGVNLTGQGLLASYFECTVSGGDCLTYNATQTSGPDTRTSNPTSVWQGFTLTGYALYGYSYQGYTGTIYPLNLFHFKDARGLTIRDVAADGATGACFLFENVNYWTERNLFENVSTMYNCPIGFRFIVDSTDTYNSFGYNRFLDIRLDLYGSQTGFSFENNGNMYNSTIRATVNKCSTSSGTATNVLHMQNTAELNGDELHIYAEDSCGSTPGGSFLNITSSSNILTYFGEISPSPYTDQNNTIASGATVTHFEDSGSFAVPANEFAHGVSLGIAKLSSGAGTPTGACVNGSLYSNTSGTTGSTLYVCVNSAWTDVK